MTVAFRSQLDCDVFGFPVYRSYAQTAASIAEAMNEAGDAGAKLLILRIGVGELSLVQKLMGDGFLLADTQCHFQIRLTERHVELANATLPARLAREGEEEALVDVARASFRGKPSHYRADPRLSPERCDELYAESLRMFYRGRNDRQKLLVVERDGVVAGVMVARFPEGQPAEGSFGAIHPSVKREAIAIYRSLVLRGMMLAWERGDFRVNISSSIQNLVVHKMLSRIGYEPAGYEYTLHYWFARS